MNNKDSFFASQILFVIPLAIIVLLLFLGGAFLIYKHFSVKDLPKEIATKPSITVNSITPSIQPTIRPVISPPAFTSRQFDPKESLFQNTHLEEITDIQDNQLVKIRCTERYGWTGKETGGGKQYGSMRPSWLYEQEIAKLVVLLDNDIKIRASNDPYSYLEHFVLCQTEDERQFVYYDSYVHPNGYITQLEPNNDLRILATFKPFCEKPLLLTKNDIFYWQCGVGDGASAQFRYMKINLQTGSAVSIFDCQTGIDKNGNEYSTCM